MNAMDDMFDADSENHAYAPKPKAPKPTSKAAKTAGKAPAPLQSSSAHNASGPDRTIEQTYQKKSQLEHVLLRPDTYIGNVEKHTLPLWAWENGGMVHKDITYVPGLYKIFDEILVNAADNKQRDNSMDMLKVDIDAENNTIRVWNNGKGVPVEVHAEEGIYVPEMIFGHLLTSSNYDDAEQKTTGGRNGFGAKLANIFSTEFIIETADGERKRQYKQVFTNNMSTKSEPEITKCKSSDNWTCVTFKPDLAKFHMECLEDDVVALMSKRVVDIAGCLGKVVKVELNGVRLPVKGFADYCGLYLNNASLPGREEPLPRIFEKINDRWEVCVSLSEGQSLQQVSFVNSINTIRGGKHVDAISDQIVQYLIEKVKKKAGKASASTIRPLQIRNHLWVFVNALIVNPAFDSQTKESLNTRPSDFGSPFKLSEDFMKKVAKSGIVENVLSWATFKASKELKRTDGSKRQRLTGIPKLDDANDAGGRNSEHCTLILTEGDSAKALAVSGLSVVGRDRYGVFPLRGKLLNVRDAAHKQISENAEINAIKQIMGLQHGKSYDNLQSLRYGHLMIMTDQDHDGSHIKGLLINFLHNFWPSLLKIPNFLLEFITPIVKASGPRGATVSFYTMPEYEVWKERLGGNTRGWTIKYYKGLGTSTPKEAKEYFAALQQHKKRFVWSGDEDGECIELAFSKKKVENRKQWLRNFEPGTFLDNSESSLNYTDFVNKELILFSLADNMRSIPSVMDGFKPGQRKIMFSCFKRKLKSDVKVAQLAGYISEHSAYHHGEASLMSTIVNLAQDFVGSNNINLLVPSGQFGTRLQGGKDSASPRYIYTRLAPLTRLIFPEADDCILDYQNEDGQMIEPTWYMPILPMVLINGSEGIGTGWSSSIPNYSPVDVVANLRRLMGGEEQVPMIPWYHGFKGSIQLAAAKEGGQSFTITGKIEQTSDTVLQITELPVRKWTQDYKEFLESQMVSTEKQREALIKDIKEYHTDTSVHFEVHLSPENMVAAVAEGLVKKFKLSTSMSTSNMHLFDEEGRMTKYDTPEQIIESFYGVRLANYEKRKAAQLDVMKQDLVKVDNRVRFILAVVKGEIVVSNRRKAVLLAELEQKKFTRLPATNAKARKGPAVAGVDEGTEEEGEEEGGGGDNGKGGKGGYDYLLGLPLWSLTLEKVEELCRERDGKEKEMEALMGTSPKELWERDLDALVEFMEACEVEAEKERANESNERSRAKGGAARKNAAPQARAKAKAPVRREEEEEEEYREAPKKAAAAPRPRAKPAAAPAKAPAKAQLPMMKPGAAAVRAPEPAAAQAKPMELDSDDEEAPSLAKRMAARSAASAAMAATASVPQSRPTSLPASEREAEGGAEQMQGSGLGAEAPATKASKLTGTMAAKKAAAAGKSKKSRTVVVSDSEEEEEEEEEEEDTFEYDDEDSDREIVAVGKKVAAKKGGAVKKAVVGKGATVGKKRGKEAKESANPESVLSQEFAEMAVSPNGISPSRKSPEKKVPRRRPSPFSKNSSKVEALLAGDGGTDEDVAEVRAGGRKLPARASRATIRYVISDDEPEDSDDDFHEDSE